MDIAYPVGAGDPREGVVVDEFPVIGRERDDGDGAGLFLTSPMISDVVRFASHTRGWVRKTGRTLLPGITRVSYSRSISRSRYECRISPRYTHEGWEKRISTRPFFRNGFVILELVA